jgi:hypothetical protein
VALINSHKVPVPSVSILIPKRVWLKPKGGGPTVAAVYDRCGSLQPKVRKS